MGGVPQRLVEDVAEAQCHQILHRLLAEIMVDAEDLMLGEDLAYRVVDCSGRGEIVADRLLDNDATLLGNEAVRAEPPADIVEKVWSDGEVEGAHLVEAVCEGGGKLSPAFLARGVD